MHTPTRTPEGWPNRCPLCGHDVCIDPSRPTLDAPCPHCGQLLWFSRADHATQIDTTSKMLASRLAPGVSAVGLFLRLIPIVVVALFLGGLYSVTPGKAISPVTAILGLVGIILFGKRLPEIGYSLGRTITEWLHSKPRLK